VPVRRQVPFQGADQPIGFHTGEALVCERARPGIRVKSHHNPIRGGPCRRPEESANRCRSTVCHTSSATCRPMALVR
jgi:hypothetical protein